ncbi:hypothetical protein [Sporosarcina sp. FSL K6-1508]|uniref:hypothetical protein n=1 Tax=Sporosarcina sp. FSL K6-1508 TaxID=2921553 RepID=UPI0030F56882
MANKRNRQKQMNSSKTIEGFERHLLQQLKKWNDVQTAAGSVRNQEAINNIYYYKRVHENLRNFYFDL